MDLAEPREQETNPDAIVTQAVSKLFVGGRRGYGGWKTGFWASPSSSQNVALITCWERSFHL